MKSKFKYCIKYIIIFIVLFTIFISTLLLSAIIPSNLLKNNVGKSLNVLKKEGAFHEVISGINYKLDNYTDALMINTAYCIDNEEPFNSILLARRNYQSDRDDIKLVEVDSENTILNLELTLNNENTEYYEYSRYWHGYLIYLRPLLLITDYVGIRIILVTLINILFIITTYLIYNKINLKCALAFFISMIASSIYLIGLSMQYSSVFIIFLCACIYILKNNKKIRDIKILFFITGALTSFMDLLTCPILTFCIPFIIYITMNRKDNKENFKQMIKLGMFWVLGYCIIWISKWIITDILCGTNTIFSAKQGILRHSSGQNNFSVGILDAITKNIGYVRYFLIVPIILLVEINFIDKKYINKELCKENFIYILIGIIPFLWYAFIKNHSYVHARFTYKDLSITIFCILIILFNNLSLFIKKQEANK